MLVKEGKGLFIGLLQDLNGFCVVSSFINIVSTMVLSRTSAGYVDYAQQAFSPLKTRSSHRGPRLRRPLR